MRRTTLCVLGAGALLTGAGLAPLIGNIPFSSAPAAAPSIPREYRALVRTAAASCPAIPPVIFAAQLQTESGWDPRAVSRAGAQGIAQFMPTTWDQYGLDGDGDGVRDVWDPADAIPAAAALNCVNLRLVREVPGDPVRNALAAFNAGYNQVIRYGGVPPFPETQTYIERIMTTSDVITW